MNNEPSLSGPGFRMPPRMAEQANAKLAREVSMTPGIQDAAILRTMWADMPQWAIAMSQQVMVVQLEIRALRMCLEDNHVVTEGKFMSIFADLNAATEVMINQCAERLGRQFSQSPTPPRQAAAHTDPRRSPSPSTTR